MLSVIKITPDFRQAITDSWPMSMDDSDARKEEGWKPKYDLSSLTSAMIKNPRPVAQEIEMV
ncbi:MAG: hypothetical protein COB81_10865 [Flavobacteriaceae bacterium]|nr:MAG: hypothetical protein COB81_10865 [Flavobacteriaceae bacterium]